MRTTAMPKTGPHFADAEPAHLTHGTAMPKMQKTTATTMAVMMSIPMRMRKTPYHDPVEAFEDQMKKSREARAVRMKEEAAAKAAAKKKAKTDAKAAKDAEIAKLVALGSFDHVIELNKRNDD